MRRFPPLRAPSLAIATLLLIPIANTAVASAACVSRVTNQPVACLGARPSAYGAPQLGLGASLVLAGPASSLPLPRVCRNPFTGRIHPCRALPPPALPPSAPTGSEAASAPPQGYGPPH